MAQGESDPGQRHRLQISLTQLLAGVLATVTAALGASSLGVNGTVIGAAVMSLISAAGTAVYTHSLKRTGEKMRAAVPARFARVGTGAVAVFIAALAVVTVVELAAGRPLSDLVRGRSGSGTTAFGQTHATAPGRTTPAPAVTVTRTVVPKIIVSTPTITSTAPAVTVTPTVTASPAATPSPSAPATSVPATPSSTPSP